MKEIKGKVVVFHADEKKEFYYDDKTTFNDLRKLVQFSLDWPYDETNGRMDELQFAFRHKVVKHFEYDKTIASYNLPDNTELVAGIVVDQCKPKHHAPVIGKVIIKTGDDISEYNYTNYTTIGELKKQIQSTPGWFEKPDGSGKCDLDLVVRTTQGISALYNDKTVASYNLSKDAVILVVVHAKGCCEGPERASSNYMKEGFLIGLGVSLAHCTWKACSSSNLATSFGARLLEEASPKVCLGIILTGVILGAMASKSEHGKG